MNVAFDLGLRLPPRNGQIVVGLEIYPELGCSAEESRQSEGHLRGNATLLLNDFIDARRRDSQSQCKLIRVQTEGDYKLLAKDLPRMDELALVSSHFPLSDNLRSLRRTHRLLATQSCRSRYLF